MKKLSRLLLFSALTLVLLTACTGQEGSPTAVGTIPGNGTSYPGPAETATTSTEATLASTPTATPTESVATDTPQAAATDTTQTPGVPVTGADVNLLDCQYCIDGVAHAILVLPETMTFQTVSDTTLGPDMGCNIVDTYNGRQTVICRAEENTSFSLNICTDGTNCTALPVELQPCPVNGTAEPGVTNTPEAGTLTSTPTGATGTPATTSPTPTATPTATP